MPNIKEVTSRINSVNSTQQITKAMKMVAAAKLTKGQIKLLQLRTYTKGLSDMLRQIIWNIDQEVIQEYTQPRPTQTLLLIVISAEKGLCGSFHTNVAKKACERLRQFSNLSSEKIDLLIIGKKALNFFQKKEYNLINTYVSLASQLNFENVSQAAEFLIQTFLNHTYDRIELIYNMFGTAASQFIQLEQFLPVLQPDPLKIDKSLYYIYEPSGAALARQLIPMYLKIQLYKSLLESNVSENGARMTTMSKATDNAHTILKSLRITYNKTRQAAITNEILEIAAGAEALTNS